MFQKKDNRLEINYGVYFSREFKAIFLRKKGNEFSICFSIIHDNFLNDQNLFNNYNIYKLTLFKF